MATALALIGVLVGVGQLGIGVAALRPRNSAPDGEGGAAASPVRDLAHDRRALDYLLVAATSLALASVALFIVEDSIDQREEIATFQDRFGTFQDNLGQTDLGDQQPEMPSEPRIRSDDVELVFVVVALVLSVVAIIAARIAWRKYLHVSGSGLTGVVMAVTLVVLSGVVALVLLTDLSRLGLGDLA